MFTTIVIIGIVGWFIWSGVAEQARQDEYYQQESEAQRQRSREHDVRMGRK
jgi:hypothetical protein